VLQKTKGSFQISDFKSLLSWACAALADKGVPGDRRIQQVGTLFTRSVRGTGLTRAVSFLISVSALGFLLSPEATPRAGVAHEPITTKIMFDKEVVRILQENCLGCHRPGGIAMSLATYEDARPWAKAIKEEILERRMPPWPAMKGYGDFANAPALTQRDIDMIVNWVEGGAPMGDPKDLPAGPVLSGDWPLGSPDLVLKPDFDFKLGPDGDSYQTFRLPTGLGEDKWVSGVDLLPGSASVVHCATIYIERPTAPESSRKLSSLSLLGSWVPGQRPLAFPPDLGVMVPAGADLVLKVHYRGAGEAATDRSAVGLYFAKAPVKRPLKQICIDQPESMTPAGPGRYQAKASCTIQGAIDLLAICPLVDPLLISLEATAYRPDGSAEVLVWTRRSKFDWQPTYRLKRPAFLPQGTRVEAIAYFDSKTIGKTTDGAPAGISHRPLCTLMLAPFGGTGN
jgi:hypothetical protein